MKFFDLGDGVSSRPVFIPNNLRTDIGESSMSQFKVSTNLDCLMNLPKTDDYLFYNYRWEQAYPDMPNRVYTCFDTIEEAMAIHHELWKLRITPLFKKLDLISSHLVKHRKPSTKNQRPGQGGDLLALHHLGASNLIYPCLPFSLLDIKSCILIAIMEYITILKNSYLFIF